MRKLNSIGFGSMVIAAAGLFALSAGGSGCSSEDEAAVATEAGTDAPIADTGVVVVVDPDAAPCERCVEIASADRRIPGSAGACTTDSFSQGTTKSSKQIFDEAFQCVCGDKCKDSCGDSCGSGAALSPLCTACAASQCIAEYDECLADDPLLAQDSGVVQPTDSGADTGVVDDSGIADAGANGQ